MNLAVGSTVNTQQRAASAVFRFDLGKEGSDAVRGVFNFCAFLILCGALLRIVPVSIVVFAFLSSVL